MSQPAMQADKEIERKGHLLRKQITGNYSGWQAVCQWISHNKNKCFEHSIYLLDPAYHHVWNSPFHKNLDLLSFLAVNDFPWQKWGFHFRINIKRIFIMGIILWLYFFRQDKIFIFSFLWERYARDLNAYVCKYKPWALIMSTAFFMVFFAPIGEKRYKGEDIDEKP